MKQTFFSIAFLLICSLSFAQAKPNVTIDKNGNFIAIKNNLDTIPKATGKTYTDSKGNVFPVSVSASGKYFVIRVSKSGRAYKQYLNPQQ